MKIDRLFHVLVLSGASSTVGLAACSNSNSPTESDGGTGGKSATGGGTSKSDASPAGSATGGSTSGGGKSGGDASMCMCKPETQIPSWIDCGGCCCWLPAGQTSPAATPICGPEPCCIGHGRTTATK